MRLKTGNCSALRLTYHRSMYPKSTSVVSCAWHQSESNGLAPIYAHHQCIGHQIQALVLQSRQLPAQAEPLGELAWLCGSSWDNLNGRRFWKQYSLDRRDSQVHCEDARTSLLSVYHDCKLSKDRRRSDRNRSEVGDGATLGDAN